MSQRFGSRAASMADSMCVRLSGGNVMGSLPVKVLVLDVDNQGCAFQFVRGLRHCRTHTDLRHLVVRSSFFNGRVRASPAFGEGGR